MKIFRPIILLTILLSLAGYVVSENYIDNLVTRTVQFVVGGDHTLGIGEVAWDSNSNTTRRGLPYGSSLLDGQELLEPIHNETGGEVTNGQSVYFDTAHEDGHLTIGLTRPDIFPRFAGLITTDSIADDGEGWVVTYGVAHDVPIAGLTLNQATYADPLVPGGLTNVEPTYPDYAIFIGAVIKDNGDGTGDIRVNPYLVQREVPTPVVLSYSSPSPSRDAKENVHGGLTSLATAHDLDAGALTLSGTVGVGKLLIVVNSATPDCEITVNGTQVDRNNNTIETPDQDSVITVDTTTTDTSGTDTNSYAFNDFQDAYITDKWFSGIPLGGAEDVIISCTGTTCPTDVDVYQISFEQFNDARYINLRTADMTYFTGSQVGKISSYLYTVEVTDDKVSLTNQGAHVRTAAQHAASQMYRIRVGDEYLDLTLDGSTDGVFLTVEMSGNDRFTDAGIKLWGDVLY